MKLPVIEFDEYAHKFNKDSYAMELKLPPLSHVSKNQKNIPCCMDKILTVKILETNRRRPQLYGQLERQTPHEMKSRLTLTF